MEGKLSRRDFLKIGSLSILATATGPTVNWLQRLNFLPADTDPSGETLIKNISHSGPDVLVDSLGAKYKVTMNQNAMATLFLKAAEIEGGTRLVDKSRQWLENNQITVYTSPYRSLYSLFFYPQLKAENFFAIPQKLSAFQKNKPLKIPTEIPPITRVKNGLAVVVDGCVFPPLDTTDGKTAVVLNNGLVFSEFARAMCSKNLDFARTHPLEKNVFEIMRTPSYIPGHEFWHVARWVQDPEHEYEIVHGQSQLAIYNHDIEDKQKNDTLIAIGTGTSAGVIDNGTVTKKVAKAVITGLGTKNGLNQIHQIYQDTPHPEPNTSRINDAFDYDPSLQAITADCFSFTKIN